MKCKRRLAETSGIFYNPFIKIMEAGRKTAFRQANSDEYEENKHEIYKNARDRKRLCLCELL